RDQGPACGPRVPGVGALAAERRDAPLRVALTFDAEHPDRPGTPPDATERILESLASRGARATFFLQGRWAEAQPALAARMASDGHLIGSHSHYHAPMTLLSDRGIRYDLRSAAAAIRKTTGVDPRPWFRCPFTAGEDDPRVIAALSALGYRVVSQHVVPRDWEPRASADDLVERTLHGVRAHGDGAIILLHAWPEATARALPIVLDRLAEHAA